MKAIHYITLYEDLYYRSSKLAFHSIIDHLNVEDVARSFIGHVFWCDDESDLESHVNRLLNAQGALVINENTLQILHETIDNIPPDVTKTILHGLLYPKALDESQAAFIALLPYLRPGDIVNITGSLLGQDTVDYLDHGMFYIDDSHGVLKRRDVESLIMVIFNQMSLLPRIDILNQIFALRNVHNVVSNVQTAVGHT